MNASDLAEFSTLRAQVGDILERVTAIAERYDDSTETAIATEAFAAERALVIARRALDRAVAHFDR